jgi:toxin HigB-1
MIRGFRHKGLQQLFEEDNAKGVNAEHVRKIKQILALLDAATTLSDLDIQNLPATPPKGRPEGVLVDHRARQLADHFSL